MSFFQLLLLCSKPMISCYIIYYMTMIIYLFIVQVSYTSLPVQKTTSPVVMPPPNHTSLPSTAATFLATHLMAVLQLSGYSVFHGGDTPIQLSLP